MEVSGKEGMQFEFFTILLDHEANNFHIEAARFNYKRKVGSMFIFVDPSTAFCRVDILNIVLHMKIQIQIHSNLNAFCTIFQIFPLTLFKS